MSFDSRPSSDLAEWPVEVDGFSPAAVAALREAMAAGHGRMAQFQHPEFGGAGQWMRNGMLMIGDMGNDALRARVARLCERLASAHAPDAQDRSVSDGSFQRQIQTAGGATRVQDSRWPDAGWPVELGAPETSGAQNGMRYAWFAQARRLVVHDRGHVAQYDTGDHRISGVSQQQGDASTLIFSSQHGPIDLRSLPAAGQRIAAPDPDRRAEASLPEAAPHRSHQNAPNTAPSAASATDDPFTAIEQLADLHARGIVDAAEFAAKKAELLKRI